MLKLNCACSIKNINIKICLYSTCREQTEDENLQEFIFKFGKDIYSMTGQIPDQVVNMFKVIWFTWQLYNGFMYSKVTCQRHPSLKPTFNYALANEKVLLKVKGLHDDDTSIVAINLPVWIGQVTSHSAITKGISNKILQSPLMQQLSRKNLNVAKCWEE